MKTTCSLIFALALGSIATAQQLTKLAPVDVLGGDNFAHAIAFTGGTLLVGSGLDDDAGGDSGSAYVWTGNGESWVQAAKLQASDGFSGAALGTSVDLSGGTAILGAPFDDHVNGVNAKQGSAYVFVGSGASWSQQAKLIAADPGVADAFGASVSVQADRAAVGAPADDDLGVESGSAYVFVRTGTTWSQQAKLLASDGDAADRFGFSVAIHGDTAIVGAPRGDGGANASGAAYIFVWDGSAWSEQAKLEALDAANGDGFGRCVALEGDEAVVGSFHDDDQGVSSGSVYVFERSGAVWSQAAKLTASDGEAFDGFGFSVAKAGDRIAVGAHGDSEPGAASGSMYVFDRDGSGWSESAKRVATDGARADFLGACVALSGGLAASGAPGDDAADLNSGSVCLFWIATEPVPFCSSKESSIPGCIPTFSAPAPVASVSGGPSSFDLTCGPIPGGNKVGIYIYSTSALNPTPPTTPFGQLCLLGLVRGSADLCGGTTGSCDGVLEWDFGAQLPSLSVLDPGDVVSLQAWYRDPPAVPAGANLSNGVQILVVP
jgi:hypothetical protein